MAQNSNKLLRRLDYAAQASDEMLKYVERWTDFGTPNLNILESRLEKAVHSAHEMVMNSSVPEPEKAQLLEKTTPQGVLDEFLRWNN